MNPIRRSGTAQPAEQGGRTLLELLISIAIGLVVLGAMLAIYLSTSASSRHSTIESRMNEDATIAMELIGAQLRMAGFSLPRLAAAPGGALVGGAMVSQPDRNFMGAPIRGCDHGFVDLAAEFEKLACDGSTTGAAAFAIRFEGSDPADPAVDLLPPSVDCLGQEVTATSVGALGSNFRVVESRYRVEYSPKTRLLELGCGGNGAGTDFLPQPLFQSVEDMKVQYGVAPDGASSDIQAYMSAAEVDALGGAFDQRWSRVVTVKVCLLMQGTQTESSPSSTYVDCAGKAATPAKPDGLARRAYTSVFTLRNRGGFAVAP